MTKDTPVPNDTPQPSVTPAPKPADELTVAMKAFAKARRQFESKSRARDEAKIALDAAWERVVKAGAVQ